MESNWATAMIRELRKAPQVALFSHVSPDGDCLGSMLAVGLALEKLGNQVYFFNPDPIPGNLSFLPGADRISNALPELLPDVLLFVDCTDVERTGLNPQQIPSSCCVLNLDHHISNQNFGQYNWVDSTASASGELAFALIKELGVDVDHDIATNLYTAIVTDTGSFQYGNTTAQTHRLAAELLEDIDLVRIHHYLYDQRPLAQVKLLQRAVSSLYLKAGGQLAVMTLTRRDFIECEAEDSFSEGLINQGRSIAGVEVAVLLREIEPEGVRVGLRSNLWLNVNEVASHLGGGGHQRAAGCTVFATLKQTEEMVVKVIEEALSGGRHN